MANPFLVLGGVAVGIVVASMGVLQVPGWVKSAQDAAAVNDLANIRAAQAAHSSEEGRFTDDFDLLSSDRDGLGFNLSGGVDLVEIAANDDAWCASVLSASGTYFAATSATTDYPSGSTPAEAVTAANCAPDLVGSFPTAPDNPGGGGDEQPFAAMFTLNCPTDGPATVDVELPLMTAAGTVTWSDGETVTVTDADTIPAKTLAAGTEYTVTFDGTFDELRASSMDQESADCYRSMDSWAESSQTTAADEAFYGMANLTSVPAYLPSTVETLSLAFRDATSFNSPNVARWDMSNVSDIWGMFYNAQSFQQDINGWSFASPYGAYVDGIFAWTNYQGDLKDWTFSGEGDITVEDLFQYGGPYGGSADGWTFTNDGDVYYSDDLSASTANFDDWSFANGGDVTTYPNAYNSAFAGTLSNWSFTNPGDVSFSSDMNGFTGTMSGLTFDNGADADIYLLTDRSTTTGTARDWTISTPGTVYLSVDASRGTFNGDYAGWSISESVNAFVNIGFYGTSGAGSLRDWAFTNPGILGIDTAFTTSTFTGSLDGWDVRNGGALNLYNPAYNNPAFLGTAQWTVEPGGAVNVSP